MLFKQGLWHTGTDPLLQMSEKSS